MAKLEVQEVSEEELVPVEKRLSNYGAAAASSEQAD